MPKIARIVSRFFQKMVLLETLEELKFDLDIGQKEAHLHRHTFLTMNGPYI